MHMHMCMHMSHELRTHSLRRQNVYPHTTRRAKELGSSSVLFL